ncbi:Chromate transporter domain containing protein [Elaphomyces granulatus]
MPTTLSSSISSLRALSRRVQERNASATGGCRSLYNRLTDVFSRTWDLGFTAFGGPPVHFRIFHQRFVEGKGGKPTWVDEQTYQELFAICQALPGPGSTKMIFCLTLLHAGFLPAVFVFIIWSLPGAIGMYSLSLGVQNINSNLPLPVYALLSGMNASTVGIIALAAVQLAEKAIRDRLSRILVIFGACAGLCYNSLWYFPVLMLIGGLACVVWDGFLSQRIGKAVARLKRKRRNPEAAMEETGTAESVAVEMMPSTLTSIQKRPAAARLHRSGEPASMQETPEHTAPPHRVPEEDSLQHVIKVWVGITILISFLISFIGIVVARGVIQTAPLALDVFANMYLAGTIIFGGGPVVIPLLRSYVVDPGWVSGRDFLFGLAIIQAFPGPNFNFAVFLGALALQHSEFSTILGAFLGFFGIFFPGIALAVAVQSFWRVLRTKKLVLDLLRGLNATAVGLVFTAVYRLWEIGYLTPMANSGQSLAMEPWWVLVAAVTYSESAWFNVPPALAIVIGAVLGLGWYGVVGQRN